MTTDTITTFKFDNKLISFYKKRNAITVVAIGVYWVILSVIFPGWVVNGHAASPLQNFTMACTQTVVYAGIILIIMLSRTEKALNGLTITVNNAAITLTNSAGVNKGFKFINLKYAVKTYNGDLNVYYGEDKALAIPHSINGFNELEEIIKEKAPFFLAGPYSIIQKNARWINTVFFALFLTILTQTNLIAMLVLGAIVMFAPWFAYIKSYQKITGQGVSLSSRFFNAPIIWSILVILAVLFKLFIK
ncbi:hypothetical protein [Mucilaginibacter sp. dw_454]|uniref:hypothetical protein n=1 Tax=Mucilaginibacter sp. dw_454 TaxID=2720079 RepID=UPI001BD51D0A|nr:hypothetical protein [Mucilaginibacter sp. dw_454]